MAKKDKKLQPQDNESAFSDLAKKFKANPAVFIGTVFVLVLVTVSFVVVPAIVPENRGAGDLTFGFYDRAPIAWAPENKFAQNVNRGSQQRQNYMDINDFHVMRSIWEEAFQATTVHVAVLQEMKRSRFTIPESIVNREVARMPQFQVNGDFSPTLWRQVPETRQLSLLRQTREDLSVFQYYNDLYSLSIPESEKNFFVEMGDSTKMFQLVSFLVDDFPEAEYLAFAENNADLFSTIHLSRIVVPSEREAKRILESVQNGTSTFEDAARSQSQDTFADRGGDTGSRILFELEREFSDPEVRQAIFALGKGELSEAVRFDGRWAVFRAEESLAPANFSDSATMDRVRWHMRNFERGRMEDWAIAQALDFIADAEISGFNTAARVRGREIYDIGPLPINFGSIDLFPSLEYFPLPIFSRNELSSLANNANFWRVAFSAPLNTPSQPVVHGRNVLVLLPSAPGEAQEAPMIDIASDFSLWLNFYTERSLPSYFMASPKMDNRFEETFNRNFRQPDYNDTRWEDSSFWN